MHRTPSIALERLKEGNRRFLADEVPLGECSHLRRLAVAAEQSPFAALVGCSDSRVGPETLFGTGLGDLFIVRTAGNNLDLAGLGSIEFAVRKLEVRLIVVLGHDRCGAVQAAFDVVEQDQIMPSAMAKVVEPIVPSVLWAKRTHSEADEQHAAASYENVRRMVARLRQSAETGILVAPKSGELMIVGAHYDLSTGAVDFFDVG